MQPENLAYALVQLLHNFGAAAVLGGAVFALWPTPRLAYWQRFVWLILAGWTVQILSGGLFGLTSLHYYGTPPELAPVALGALVVKVGATAAAWLLAGLGLLRGKAWGSPRKVRVLRMLAGLAATALAAAAFLRWFS